MRVNSDISNVGLCHVPMVNVIQDDFSSSWTFNDFQIFPDPLDEMVLEDAFEPLID